MWRRRLCEHPTTMHSPQPDVCVCARVWWSVCNRKRLMFLKPWQQAGGWAARVVLGRIPADKVRGCLIYTTPDVSKATASVKRRHAMWCKNKRTAEKRHLEKAKSYTAVNWSYTIFQLFLNDNISSIKYSYFCATKGTIDHSGDHRITGSCF